MIATASVIPSIENLTTPEVCGTVYMFNPYRVKVFEGQIRKRFRAIRELAASIKQIGQTTPAKVLLLSGDPDYDAVLCDGERRLRACKLLKYPIKAVEDDGVRDEDTQFEHCVAANFGKQNHDVAEILDAILRFQEKGKTIKEISATFGKSQGWVSQHISLQKLHPEVLQMMVPPGEKDPESEQETSLDLASDGQGSKEKERHRRSLLAFTTGLMLTSFSEDVQLSLAKEIVANGSSLAKARRIIMAKRNEDGAEKSSVRFKPAEEWRTFKRVIGNNEERVLTVLEMPSLKFLQMARSVTDGDRKEFVEELRKLSSDLAQIADIVDKVRDE